MERIRALINKLHLQSEENADASVLMATVQMIQSELARIPSTVPKQAISSKVSVMLPSANRVSFPTNDIIQEPAKPEHKQPPVVVRQPEPVEHSRYAPGPVKQPEPVEQPRYVQEPVKQPAPVEQPRYAPEPAEQPRYAPEPVKRVPEKEVHQVEAKKEDQSGWLFNRHEDIPTLAHQKEYKERNDVFGGNSASLNDRLKTEKKELGSVLTDAPVRDLKKAIGINDRFVFLNELFRGDEAMYERSLKTINNFRIYPEAEYWIERELKVKLGWDENKDAVKHFRQLVKRRFQ